MLDEGPTDALMIAGFPQVKFTMIDEFCIGTKNKARQATRILCTLKLRNLSLLHRYNLFFEKYLFQARLQNNESAKRHYLNSFPCQLGSWAEDYVMNKKGFQVQNCTFVELKNVIENKLQKRSLKNNQLE